MKWSSSLHDDEDNDDDDAADDGFETAPIVHIPHTNISNSKIITYVRINSQKEPVYFKVQLHVKPVLLLRAIHSPLFWQGLGSHWSLGVTLTEQSVLPKSGGHLHLKVSSA